MIIMRLWRYRGYGGMGTEVMVYGGYGSTNVGTDVGTEVMGI